MTLQRSKQFKVAAGRKASGNGNQTATFSLIMCVFAAACTLSVFSPASNAQFPDPSPQVLSNIGEANARPIEGSFEIRAGEWPMWGGSPHRNHVASGRMPPDWDLKTGRNVLWNAPLGTQTYSSPVVSDGKVFIGTNNGANLDPRLATVQDLSRLLCLDQTTGKLLWQYASEKLPTGRVHDWPYAGLCSTACVIGDRLWVLTNRCEVLCLDTEGFRDNENDGAFTDETNRSELDADVVWKFDMFNALGVRPLHQAVSNIAVVDGLVLLNTSNSSTESRDNVPASKAPDFLALEANTGSVVWQHNSTGESIVVGVSPCGWSGTSPAVATIGGVSQAIFAGRDGWLYSFDFSDLKLGKTTQLWKFDWNPKTSRYTRGGGSTRNTLVASPVVVGNHVFIATGRDPEEGEGPGDLWCVDGTKRGDISSELVFNKSHHDGREPIPHKPLCACDPKQGDFTRPNPNSGAIWHYGGSDRDGDSKLSFEESFHRSLGSPAIQHSLLFIADYSGLMHCIDARTGEALWADDLLSAVWSTCVIADGKVLIGDEDGNLTIYRAARTRQRVHGDDAPSFGASIYSTPAIANDTLFVATKDSLFAIREEIRQANLQRLVNPAFLLPGHYNMVDVRFDNNDTELVAVSAYQHATVRRCDVVGRTLISEVNLVSDKQARPFRDGSFKLSGDGRRVVATTDEYVGIWDTATGELLKKMQYPARDGIYTCSINKLDCTPDLSLVAGYWEMPGRMTLVYDAHVMIWDGVSGELLQTVVDKNATTLQSIDLSTDGKLLVTTNGSGAKVWETSTGELIRSFENDNKGRTHSDPAVKGQYNNHVWSVQFSPDGKQLAVGDILGARLWDVESGELRHLLDASYRYGTGALVYSKDGQLLARTGTSGKEKGVVPIWSTQTGKKLFDLQTGAHCGAFSDDNKRFAVGLSERQMALAVFQLSGDAGAPQVQPLENVNTPGGLRYHQTGKTAQELIDQWKPAWGEEHLGIQYGIAISSEQRQFRDGQRVPMMVFFRNVSDKPLQVDVRPDFFWDVPSVTASDGTEVKLEKTALLGNLPHYREKLQPGETFGAIYLSIGLGENPRPGQQDWKPYWKTPVVRQCKLQHTIAFKVGGLDASKDDRSDSWKPGQLTTGTIEFQIVDGDKAAVLRPVPSDNLNSERAETPPVVIIPDPLVKYGDQLIVSWVHHGDHRTFPNNGFRIAVLKDGTVIAAGDSNRNRECQIKLTSAQLEKLLQEFDEQDQCFKLVADSQHFIKPNESYNEWDRTADWYHVRRGEKEMHVGCIYGWESRTADRIPGAVICGKLMTRLNRLISVTRAGGWDEIERLLPAANAALKQSFPELAPLTVTDFWSSE